MALVPPTIITPPVGTVVFTVDAVPPVLETPPVGDVALTNDEPPAAEVPPMFVLPPVMLVPALLVAFVAEIPPELLVPPTEVDAPALVSVLDVLVLLEPPVLGLPPAPITPLPHTLCHEQRLSNWAELRQEQRRQHCLSVTRGIAVQERLGLRNATGLRRRRAVPRAMHEGFRLHLRSEVQHQPDLRRTKPSQLEQQSHCGGRTESPR